MAIPDLGAPLTPSELESLRELDKRMMQRVIPDADKRKLVSLGYAKEALGGTMITDAGKLRLMGGRFNPLGR